MTTPDGHQWTYLYDDRGNVKQMTEPNGAVVDYTYDSLGRIKNVSTSTVPAGVRAINDTFVWCANAAALGELCEERSSLHPGVRSYEYTAEGALESHTLTVPNQFSKTVLFSYDLGARLHSIVYPDSRGHVHVQSR